MARRGTTFKEYLHERLRDPEFRREYEALGPRFELANALIKLRLAAGLTQAQLAERIGTKQEYVARIEGKPTNITLKTLARLAGALNADLELRFIPEGEIGPLEVKVPARALMADGLIDRLDR